MHTNRQIAIIGAGPRGLSVLERLCANARTLAPDGRGALLVHLVDPCPPGGAVWRTEQQTELLMNTVASQVTLFTDASLSCAGPVESGPSLYEWARLVTVMEGVEPCPAEVAREAARLGPDDYPSRAFYGHYLGWVYRRVVETAPRGVTVRFHRSHALKAGEDDTGQRVLLGDGGELAGLDAVVLALGHLPAAPPPGVRCLQEGARTRKLRYLPPANPADLDLDDIEPGERVILRGLGLNFFDHLARFTAGRGGTFRRGDGGRLVYDPSGEEPRLFAGSRRGVPHHARGDNQKGAEGRYVPRLLTPALASELRERGGLRFRTDLWPLISREVESVYYATLLRSRGLAAEAERLRELVLAADTTEGSRRALRHALTAAGIGQEDRWCWQRLMDPLADRRFTGRGELDGWMLRRLDEDAAQARLGNVRGPLKAALDAMRDLRNEIRLVIDRDGLDGESYRTDVQGWYSPLSAFLSIGPPRRRVEELAAVVRAGVLGFLGRRTTVRMDADSFVASSSAVGGAAVRARVLIEARLPETDIRRSEDPLLRGLLDDGEASGFRLPTAGGARHHTGGLHVGHDHRLVGADGRRHSARFALGIPTEGVHWLTAAGARPGVDSVMLRETDAVARAVLGLHDAAGVSGAHGLRQGRAGRVTA
ncbi:FAD/NAD(P)-binding protein [Streptomyces sp. NPDC091266]|uniref:FAD/NAD(P)-binding protein n=1 Tax=Streptomyces sp. NPDC091266 TaxID=3365978 RepID=UPI00382C8928